MRRVIKGTIFLLLIAITLSSCSLLGRNKSIRMGKMEGRTYTNDYFGFSFNIPESWAIASEQEKKQLYNLASDTIAGDDESYRKQLNYGMLRMLYLVYASKYPLGFTGATPTLQCFAENLGVQGSLSIKSGKDYLNAVKDQMNQSGMQITLSDITSETLGGRSFDMMNVKIAVNGAEYGEKFYCTIINNYGVCFILTYLNASESKELANILETVKFK